MDGRHSVLDVGAQSSRKKLRVSVCLRDTWVDGIDGKREVDVTDFLSASWPRPHDKRSTIICLPGLWQRPPDKQDMCLMCAKMHSLSVKKCHFLLTL